MPKRNLKTQSGFSIVELLFYISIFTILFLVVIHSLTVMFRSYREVVINTDLARSSGIMENISRYIRGATSISAISGTSLTLNSTNQAGDPIVVSFALSGSDITSTVAGVSLGNLNSTNISVQGLSFSEITTTGGKAVKVEMSVSSNRYPNVGVENFYSTVVLRGSY